MKTKFDIYTNSLQNEIEKRFAYLDKTFIGERHLQINSARLDGVYTKERSQTYLEACNQLIKKWENENHTKQEYQDAFKLLFDEVFPYPEDSADKENLSVFEYLRKLNGFIEKSISENSADKS